jgi:5-methylcytosine-specific restriction endonuclease McrA
MLEEPNLEVLNIGQIESGQKPQFICPHIGCESPFNPDKLTAVTYHRRSEQPAGVQYGDLDEDPVRGHIEFYDRGDSDGDNWENRAFFCPNCGKPIKLPAKWSFGSY